MDETPRILTLKDAAARLGEPEGTMRHWRLTGKGPTSFKLGRRVMYRLEDLEDFVSKAYAETATGGAA